jgi:hypothetical protein
MKAMAGGFSSRLIGTTHGAGLEADRDRRDEVAPFGQYSATRSPGLMPALGQIPAAMPSLASSRSA